MLPKAYNPADAEPTISRRWQQARAFHAAPKSNAHPEPAYTIFIPPPNVTAALHVGHALNNTLQDILIRRARMRGFNTLWMPGTDHAGIATQAVVEKRLMQQGKRRSDYTREAFVTLVQAWKDEYEATILEQLRAMGASCDFERTRFTMDPVCVAAVREGWLRLFADGLIDKGKRLVNWDPVSQTALADDEVEMEEVDGFMWYLRYPLADGSGHVTVATTRPETMLGDTAVAVHPRDPRAAALRGKRVRLPIVGREIPIVEDDYVVMPTEFAKQAGLSEEDQNDPKAAIATGFLKVTPAHDPNDWEIGQRHQLPVINVMAPDATISERHGWEDVSAEAKPFVGQTRESARKAIVEWFKAKGLLEAVKPYRHSVGHSYRSHVPIEPYLSEQWYVLVTDDRLRGAALRAMAPDQRTSNHPGAPAPGDGELRFFPSRYARTFETWHENLRDWCVSRQLWWGHRIPVWTRRGPALSAEARAAVASMSADGATDARRANSLIPVTSDYSRIGCVHRVRRRDDGELEELVCLPETLTPKANELERAGFVQDPDVLDTWFSSALWPLSTLGWPEPERYEMEGLLETFNPSNVLCTAREIITLWVSRMVMFNRYFTGSSAQPGRLPFRHVYIHTVLQDGFGQKMSKSLANGVDPRDIIRTHGADAMRFVLAQLATETQDVRLPVDMIDPHSGETFTPSFITDSTGARVAAPIQESPKHAGKKMASFYGATSGQVAPSKEMPLALNTSARFDVGRNFATKLWNATRFALGSAGVEIAGANPGSTATPLPEIPPPITRAPAPSSPASIDPIDPIDPSTRPLVDRWILSRLRATVSAVDAALDQYRFSEYVEAVYDFFWRDLCDWYLEAIKPTVRDDPAQQAILLRTLDATLRLIHPVCPFVTESLFAVVGPASAARPAIAGLEVPPSELLTKAKWPSAKPELDRPDAVREFARMQSLVNAIRNLRGERQVAPKRKIILSAPAGAHALIRSGGGVVETLAGLERVDVADAHGNGAAARPSDGVPLPFEGAELVLRGLTDSSDSGAERARLRKLVAELRARIDGYERKLGNPGYVEKAPADVVAQTRQMLESARRDLSAAEGSLAGIGV